MSGLDRIYDVLKNNSATDGLVFAVTPDNHLAEFYFLDRVIVKITWRLPLEQLAEVVKKADFSKINYSPARVRMEDIDNQAIKIFFPLSVSYITEPDSKTLLKSSLLARIDTLKVMLYLCGKGTAEGMAAATIMAEQLGSHFKDFSMTQHELRRRLDQFAAIFGFQNPIHNLDSIPSEPFRVLNFVLGQNLARDAVMEAAILHYLFFGADFSVLYPSTVDWRLSPSDSKNTLAGAPTISIPANIQVRPFRQVIIYKGTEYLGQMHAQRFDEHIADKKKAVRNIEIFLSNQDIKAFKIKVGDSVNLIFV